MSHNIPPVSEELPKYGWRNSFTYRPESQCKPFAYPRMSQLPQLVVMSLRYFFRFWLRTVYKDKKRPFIDALNPVKWHPIYGVPLGGIGGGTIGRGYRGEFCRYQLLPGIYEHHTVMVNQFIVTVRRRGGTVYQQVLSPDHPKSGSPLNSWNWGFCEENATYHALYPRSWTVYDIPSQKLRLICRQVSPFIPHEYQDSSLPCSAFVWRVINYDKEPVEVTITFTFKNGNGSSHDVKGGVESERFQDSEMEGCLIHQVLDRNTPCTYGIGVKRNPDSVTSVFTAFNPRGTESLSCMSRRQRGQYTELSAESQELPGPAVLWQQLLNTGQLHFSPDRSRLTVKGEELAVGVACQWEIKSGESREMEFSLVWHMPDVKFRSGLRRYTRRYIRWFEKCKTTGAIHLASHTLQNYKNWEEKIEKWQNPILSDSTLPDWYKSALFNELYFISDGGTVWLDNVPSETCLSKTDEEKVFEVNELKNEIGTFGYLEGQEYRMYNTYDVHYYASWALAKLWPKIQMSIQYDFARSTASEDPTEILYIHLGNRACRKERYSVPHDLGDPEDEPWLRVNAYCMYPTHDWKDLNPKFVLTTYRDWKLMKDRDYLERLYPLVLKIMYRSKKFDTDGDGMIDNGGYADQTYDCWPVTGPSAYCGGLWLAALYATIDMAREVGDEEKAKEFEELLLRAQDVYETQLWTGSYYKYDCSGKWYHDSIMSDQLNGHWYLRACGAPENSIIPSEHVHMSLDTIFKYNCQGMKNGQIGAINGVFPSGRKDISSVQSEEFWVGVGYALAATMIREGKVEEGMQVAQGMFYTLYHQYGLQFQTPEAYLDNQRFRSLGYMRPLCIWAIQHALEQSRSVDS